MAKQLLGTKKTAICERIIGTKILAAYTSGCWGHKWAECWIKEKTAVVVNYRTGFFWLAIRDGEFIPIDELLYHQNKVR
jgi:hypothetical protein